MAEVVSAHLLDHMTSREQTAPLIPDLSSLVMNMHERSSNMCTMTEMPSKKRPHTVAVDVALEVYAVIDTPPASSRDHDTVIRRIFARRHYKALCFMAKHHDTLHT